MDKFVRGYKVFEEDWTCSPNGNTKQYTCPGKFEEDINDWLRSDTRYLLNQIPKDVVEWVYEEDMTDEEKSAHPTYETTGGYLRVLDESESAQIWWDGLSKTDKSIIKAIPNFDGKIFEECTGIKIREVGE